MINPDCIIRTNRRSISLSILRDGKVVVRAPRKLSMEKIMIFIEEKQSWIKKHIEKIQQIKLVNFDIKNYDSFMILGKKYTPKQINGVKRIELCSEEIIYPTTWAKKTLISKMSKFYKELAFSVLNNRIEYFANLMQLDYKSFNIKNYKSRWGCCTKEGDIIINYKAIMLPHSIIDYILIHELSHLMEFNHSNKFYKLIEAVMPDYKKYRNNLKNYNFLLSL